MMPVSNSQKNEQYNIYMLYNASLGAHVHDVTDGELPTRKPVFGEEVVCGNSLRRSHDGKNVPDIFYGQVFDALSNAQHFLNMHE